MDFLVNLDVDDIDKAVRFYRSAFGLKVARRLGEGVMELVGGPAPIYLLAKAAGTFAASTASAVRTYGRHWTPLHLDFVVKDIEAAMRKAVAAGAVLEEPIGTHKWGRLALMADPFGHGFCLVQFRGRGYGEIAARSKPLATAQAKRNSRGRKR